MKKTICSAGAFIVAILFLWQESPAQRRFDRRSPDIPSTDEATAADETTAEDEPSQQTRRAQQLKSELLRLMQQRVDLMDEGDLAAEISRMKKTQNDMIARQKLKHAQRLLNELVENHPDSPAAAQARRMLHAAPESPFGDKPEIKPVLRLRRNVEAPRDEAARDEPKDLKPADTNREREPRRVIENPFGEGQRGPKPARPRRVVEDPFGDDG